LPTGKVAGEGRIVEDSGLIASHLLSPLPEDRVDGPTAPVLICLLGGFRLLIRGQQVVLRGRGKGEAILSRLALRSNEVISRDSILDTIWPGSEPMLAGQSMNSLVYSLHKLARHALSGAPAILYTGGGYQLNLVAGVGVDVAIFDRLASDGREHMRTGHADAAIAAFSRAVRLYRGDLAADTDLFAIIERERLRALYLTLLSDLADYHHARGDYGACLAHSLALLAHEPAREDAVRMAMRCYVRRGERAQALRQYRLCQQILRSEFDATPEPATTALFDQVRLYPTSI
jgi:DNA-binding SARP family transcriptional activator